MANQSYDVFRYVGNAMIVWAAVVGAASVYVHTRVRWWASEMGRHLMAYMAIIDAVLVLSCARIVFGDSWWFQLFRLVVFTGVPVVMTHRLWLQLKARRAPLPTEGRTAR